MEYFQRTLKTPTFRNGSGRAIKGQCKFSRRRCICMPDVEYVIIFGCDLTLAVN